MELARLATLDPGLDREVESVLRHYDVPGAAVTVIHDGTAYARLFGVKRVGRGDAIGPRTAFNVGSTSKAFVSCAAAALVSEGRISWDDPVQRLVPEFELYDPWITRHVTLRDLASNRTGLPRLGLTEYGFDPDVPVSEIFRRVKHTKPIAGFRERFTYVNPGHTAVAVAIGRAAGGTFLEVLRDRVLAPMGAAGISGGVAARTELTDFAHGHCDAGDGTQVVAPIYTDNYLGSGGMWVCAEDAALWLQLHLDGGRVGDRQVLHEKALRETHLPQTVVQPDDIAPWIGVPGARFAAYGLGWAMSEWEGEWVIGHSGSDVGVSSQIAFAPQRGIGLAVYLNKNCAAALELRLALMQRLLQRAPRDWRSIVSDPSLPSTHITATRVAADPEPGTKAALALEAYAGRYSHPGSGLAIVTAEGGSLALEFEEGHLYDAELKPLGGHDFLFVSRHPANRASMRVRVNFVVEGTRAVRMVVPELEEFSRPS